MVFVVGVTLVCVVSSEDKVQICWFLGVEFVIDWCVEDFWFWKDEMM